jgi:hypothetical protein
MTILIDFKIDLQPNCEYIEASQRKGIPFQIDNFAIITTIGVSCFGLMILVLAAVMWR